MCLDNISIDSIKLEPKCMSGFTFQGLWGICEFTKHEQIFVIFLVFCMNLNITVNNENYQIDDDNSV